jgi:hypothetical protein
MKRWIVRIVIVGALAFGGLQLLPFGRIPRAPVTADAPWPSVEARRLAVAACYDCHSNEPRVEWFDRIAPGSWIVAEHVRDGREEVNFSEWDRVQLKDDDLSDVVEDSEMPLREYTWLHPEARLTNQEKQTLVDALRTLEGGQDDHKG